MEEPLLPEKIDDDGDVQSWNDIASEIWQDDTSVNQLNNNSNREEKDIEDDNLIQKFERKVSQTERMTAENKLKELKTKNQLSQSNQSEMMEKENSFSSKMESKFKVDEGRIVVVDILIELLRYLADIQNRSFEEWIQQLKLKLKLKIDQHHMEVEMEEVLKMIDNRTIKRLYYRKLVSNMTKSGNQLNDIDKDLIETIHSNWYIYTGDHYQENC